MWISRENMLFATTACATCMKLSTLLLSLRSSSTGREDQAKRTLYWISTSPVQVFRQRPDLHLNNNFRNTKQTPDLPVFQHCRVQAGCTSMPGDLLSHLLEYQIAVHTLGHVDSHVFGCFPTTHARWSAVSVNRRCSKE